MSREWTAEMAQGIPLFTDDEIKLAIATAVAAERARIVAWLRDTGDQHSLVYQAGMTVTQAADRLAEEGA